MTKNSKGECKKCGEPVLWVQMVKTDDGKKQEWIPVDLKPMKTIIVKPHPSGDGRNIGEFVVCHRVHFATCSKGIDE